jgi:hypothetical protein
MVEKEDDSGQAAVWPLVSGGAHGKRHPQWRKQRGSSRCGLAPRGAPTLEKIAASGCHAHGEAPALEKPKVAATALEKASGGQAVRNAATAVRVEKWSRLFFGEVVKEGRGEQACSSCSA